MSKQIISASLDRRHFLKTTGVAALATAAVPAMAKAAKEKKSTPESLVEVLYKTMSDKQKKEVCFDWDHVDKKRGLLRTRLENNWKITKPSIKSSFYTAEQQSLIRLIFEGMTNPDWHARWDEQLKGDVGGFGRRQSIAIFGTPGGDKFEFVLASRHMTLRCDGNSAEHLAFG